MRVDGIVALVVRLVQLAGEGRVLADEAGVHVISGRLGVDRFVALSLDISYLGVLALELVAQLLDRTGLLKLIFTYQAESVFEIVALTLECLVAIFELIYALGDLFLELVVVLGPVFSGKVESC